MGTAAKGSHSHRDHLIPRDLKVSHLLYISDPFSSTGPSLVHVPISPIPQTWSLMLPAWFPGLSLAQRKGGGGGGGWSKLQWYIPCLTGAKPARTPVTKTNNGYSQVHTRRQAEQWTVRVLLYRETAPCLVRRESVVMQGRQGPLKTQSHCHCRHCRTRMGDVGSTAQKIQRCP